MSARWSQQTKLIVTIGVLLGLVWAVFRFGRVLSPVVVAVILSYLINQSVGWIVRNTGWPRLPIVIVHFILILALLISAPAILTPRLIRAVGALNLDLQGVIVELGRRSQEPVILFGFQLEVSQLYNQIIDVLRTLLQSFVSGAVDIVFNVAAALLYLILVLVLSVYMVKDTPQMGRFIYQRIPPAYRPELRALWVELVAIWDAFFRGQVVLGIVVASLVTTVMTAVGLRNAPILGLISGLLEVIPTFGPAIAMIPGVLLALVQGSTWLPLTREVFALLVAGCYLAIQQIENHFIVPRIIGRRVHLHPVVILSGALAGAQLSGILGVFLAAPVIASLRILFGYAYAKILDLEPFKPPEVLVPTPHQRQIGGRPVRGILFDLDGALAETDDALAKQWGRRLRFLRRISSRLDTEHAARRLIGMLEGPSGRILSLLDRMGLEDEAARFHGWLCRLRGVRPADALQPVAGTPQLVRALAARYRLCIVTTRCAEEVNTFLEQNGFNGAFSVIVSGDCSRRLRPHPQPVRQAAEALGVSPAQCVLVGDTGADVQAAKAAGVFAIGVLCGFGDAKDLSDADLILPTTAHLADWL
ncbi:MAG: AI-2E family transporter [Anaerolineae bacterium]|nr:AI-2E family transporter [Anaerolineae bacterium]